MHIGQHSRSSFVKNLNLFSICSLLLFSCWHAITVISNPIYSKILFQNPIYIFSFINKQKSLMKVTNPGLFLLCIFELLFQITKCASSPVTWVTDPRFVAGTYTYIPTTTGTINNQAIIVIYPTALTAISRSVALGLVNFDFKFSTTDFIFLLSVNRTATNGFEFLISTLYGSDINELKISYLTVSATFTSPFSIARFSNSLTPPYQGPFSLTYYINFTASTGVILDLSHSNAMLAFQHMMDLSSPTKCFSVDIVFRIFNQSFYEVVISTTCNMLMYTFGFSRIIFDKTDIQALGECFFQYGELQATNGNESPLQFSTSPFYNSNFMFGMKCFDASGQNSMKFKTNIASNTKVTAAGFNFKYLSFMYWSFKKRQCPAGYPYFEISTLTCYDVCPDGKYPDNVLYICPACSYSCLTCSEFTVCTNCDPATNRFQNGTTCPPNSGFFDNGTANTIACNSVLPNCLQCIDQFTCTNCSSGFYIASDGTCQPCNVPISQCSACVFSTVVECTDCNAGFIVSADRLSCDSNPCTDANCIDCTGNAAICITCATGYQANVSCSTICGDGIIAGSQQCDDSNVVDGDGCSSTCTNQTSPSCPSTSPYLHPTTGACLSTCPVQYYNQPSNFTCIRCFYACQTCTNSNQCTSCSPTSHRILIVNDCSPQPGYYDNGTQDALPCISPCSNCSSSMICLTCVVGFYLNGADCLACSSSIAFCSECDVAGSTCTLCQNGYTLNSSTNSCQAAPCSDSNCIDCTTSIFSCNNCIIGYLVSNGFCVSLCGDFFITPTEVCDDGNTREKDGCSSTCTLQPNFQCEMVANNNTGSQCYFVGEIEVQEVYINKIEGQNKIQILLNLFPNDLAVWDEINFMDMINIDSQVPISGYQVVKNPDGTVTITVQYAESIQGKTIDITIDPNNTGHPTFSRTQPKQSNMLIIPDNNQAAYFYDQTVYDMSNIVSLLSTVVTAIAALFLILGLISAKMIGVQMMAVIQISFFSLLTLQQVNPCFAALSSLRFINGYNSLNNKHLQDSLTPTQPKGIFLFSRFGQNFNLTAIIILIPLLVSLVSFILYKTAFKDNERALKVAKKAVGQYTLMGLLFGGYMISVAFGLQMFYGLKKTNDLIGAVSVVQCIILLLMLVGYFIFLIMKPDFFGEFTQEFKRDKLPQKYYNLMLIERVLVGSCLIFLLSTGMGMAVGLAIFTVIGAYVLFKKPYKQTYHNNRVVANMSIAIAIQAIFLTYSVIAAEQKNSNPIFFYLPFIVLGCLIACVLYNGAAIIYSVYKFIKSRNLKEIELNEQKEQLSKLRNESSFINSSTPTSPTLLKPSLSSPMAMKQNLMSPSSLRTKLSLNDMKKEIIKAVNPQKNQIGLVNEMLFERNVPIDGNMKKAYDQI